MGAILLILIPSPQEKPRLYRIETERDTQGGERPGGDQETFKPKHSSALQQCVG